jgi:hypothetical protein
MRSRATMATYNSEDRAVDGTIDLYRTRITGSHIPKPQRRLWKSSVHSGIVEGLTLDFNEHLWFRNRVSPRRGKSDKIRKKFPNDFENLTVHRTDLGVRPNPWLRDTIQYDRRKRPIVGFLFPWGPKWGPRNGSLRIRSMDGQLL